MVRAMARAGVAQQKRGSQTWVLESWKRCSHLSEKPTKAERDISGSFLHSILHSSTCTSPPFSDICFFGNRYVVILIVLLREICSYELRKNMACLIT